MRLILEEKEWKTSRKYLNKKGDKKVFDDIFSISGLYNSACSYAVNPIRIYPIMMSIVLHQYKMLKERGLDNSSTVDDNNNNDNDDMNKYEYNNNINSKYIKTRTRKMV